MNQQHPSAAGEGCRHKDAERGNLVDGNASSVMLRRRKHHLVAMYVSECSQPSPSDFPHARYFQGTKYATMTSGWENHWLHSSQAAASCKVNELIHVVLWELKVIKEFNLWKWCYNPKSLEDQTFRRLNCSFLLSESISVRSTINIEY